MIFNSKRLNERTEGLELLKEALKEKNKTLVIHYSCESFLTTHGKTPRINSKHDVTAFIKNIYSSNESAFDKRLCASRT